MTVYTVGTGKAMLVFTNEASALAVAELGEPVHELIV